MRYRKKPVVIEAVEWFRNGDHPKDNCEYIADPNGSGDRFLSEGQAVRYYRHPDGDGQEHCKHCNRIMHHHGWIDTLEGGHIICPGDFVIQGVQGEMYPCKPDIFEQTWNEIARSHINTTKGDEMEPILAKKHTGMKISASGVLGRVGGHLKFGATEMLKHLKEMSSRYYDGDIAVVDEFLQLYDLAGKRPKERK